MSSYTLIQIKEIYQIAGEMKDYSGEFARISGYWRMPELAVSLTVASLPFAIHRCQDRTKIRRDNFRMSGLGRGRVIIWLVCGRHGKRQQRLALPDDLWFHLCRHSRIGRCDMKSCWLLFGGIYPDQALLFAAGILGEQAFGGKHKLLPKV